MLERPKACRYHHSMSDVSGAKGEEAGWLARAPRGLRPYLRLARLDRPVGVWLLFWPGAWSVALAGRGKPDLVLLALFALGSLVMRAAGCVVNDIADRDFDRKVARTASRPLAAGEIALSHALAFLALLSLAGLGILLSFNTFAIVLGASSLPLVAAYPFMKRFTYWPQAFLGLTFNWGALLGWAAARGTLDWPAGLLYAAGLFWTLGYDTIYAHQDKADDLAVGVKSTALLFRDHSALAVGGFYLAALALLAAAGLLGGLSWPYFAALGPAFLLLAWQVLFVHLDDAADCLAKFKSNAWLGWIVFVGMLLSPLIG